MNERERNHLAKWKEYRFWREEEEKEDCQSIVPSLLQKCMLTFMYASKEEFTTEMEKCGVCALQSCFLVIMLICGLDMMRKR